MATPKASTVPTALVADIGGTTTRFALAANGEVERMNIIVNDTATSLAAAIERYLAEAGVQPATAVLAVAAPIDGDEVVLTNRAWRFRVSELKAKFGFSHLRAVNDFEALAWALAGLRDGDTRALGGGGRAGPGVRVVLGPGTGLGVAALMPLEGGGWRAIASEGGHVSFGPASAAEEIVFDRIRDRAGPISAETVLSGPGLERLYLALHADAKPLDSHQIVGRAHNGDPAARVCVDLFVRLLGRFAGDVALMFKSTGGVYLAGGVAVGMASILDEVMFRTAFDDHPPYAEMMASIPTFLLTRREPGLLGCAIMAEQWARTNYAS